MRAPDGWDSARFLESFPELWQFPVSSPFSPQPSVTQAVSPPKEFIVMKKILISIPIIFLIALSMLLLVENTELILGALGIIQFSFVNPATELFGTLCFPIGVIILITYFY